MQLQKYSNCSHICVCRFINDAGKGKYATFLSWLRWVEEHRLEPDKQLIETQLCFHETYIIGQRDVKTKICY